MAAETTDALDIDALREYSRKLFLKSAGTILLGVIAAVIVGMTLSEMNREYAPTPSGTNNQADPKKPIVDGVLKEIELVKYMTNVSVWMFHFEDGRQTLLKDPDSNVFPVGKYIRIQYRKADGVILSLDVVADNIGPENEI